MNPQPEEQAVPETAKAVQKFTEIHAQEIGLPSPQAVNYMFSIATMLSSTALVGKDMGLSKDQVTRLREFGIPAAEIEARDNKTITSNAMAKMLVGWENGIDPMTALQDLSIVKAKVFTSYWQLHRLIEEKGWEIEEVERSHTRAAIKLTHPTKKSRDFEFTLEDAQRAGLTKRGGYNGDSPSQYELRPKVMLWARVISDAHRGTGGKSNLYANEEKQEILREEPENTTRQIAAPEPDPYAVEVPEPKGTSTRQTATDDAAGGMQSTAAAQPETVAAEPAISATGTAEPPAPENPILDKTPEPVRPKVEAMPKPKPDPRVGNLMGAIEAALPPKTRKKIIEEFLRGYFRTADLKALVADPRMADALTNLHALVSSERWKTPLAVDPHRFGVDTAAGYPKLIEYIAGWPEDCRVTAVGIALALYPDSGGGDLRAYLEDPIKAETFSFEDLRAFLFVLMRAEPKYATLFSERALDMAGMAMTWDKLTPAEMVAAIEALPEIEPVPEGQQSLLEVLRGSGKQ